MSRVVCVYSDEPNWPSTDQHPDATRYRVGQWFVDAVGGQPTIEAVNAVLGNRSQTETLAAYAAEKRYAVETGGLNVGGVSIPTDRDTQAKLTSAFLLAQADPAASFQWKTSAGFVTLTAATVGQIAVAIGQFVQAAYAAEAQVLAAIAAGTITTTAQIDAANWPGKP